MAGGVKVVSQLKSNRCCGAKPWNYVRSSRTRPHRWHHDGSQTSAQPIGSNSCTAEPETSMGPMLSTRESKHDTKPTLLFHLLYLCCVLLATHCVDSNSWLWWRHLFLHLEHLAMNYTRVTNPPCWLYVEDLWFGVNGQCLREWHRKTHNNTTTHNTNNSWHINTHRLWLADWKAF